MAYSVSIDWSEELEKDDGEKWENLGRQAIEEACTHKHDGDTWMGSEGYCDKCGHGNDTARPMMNFGYPLETTPSEDEILEVVEKTNCTIMHNTETDEYFLVLCGGGMDLSQDIALAYHIIEKWIPYELTMEVCTQKDLSVSGKNWDVLKAAMQESLKLYAERAQDTLERWS